MNYNGLITASLVGLLLTVSSRSVAQHVIDERTYVDDSTRVRLSLYSPPNRFQQITDKIISNKAFQMTYIGVPLIVSGLIVKGEDDHFHDLRNSYIPSFSNHYDDYLQYVPAVAMIGLKIGGVKGRSSWGRMLVSDAFTAALMGISVNALKYSVHVKRPDGSKNNSFPSGHTAMAFMTATMLHKEYGLTRSPWYSVGAYSIASATAVSRMMNNRHWLSDVMVGAGIGILSTELGYYLADLIFKEKGIIRNNLSFENFDYKRNPSFFGLYMGFSLMPTRFALSPTVNLKASPGSTAGFEGAWFMNRYWGIGGRLLATSMPLSLTAPLSKSIPVEIAKRVKRLQSDPLDIASIHVGPYVSYPLTDRFLAGAKILVGCNLVPSNTISVLYISESGEEKERAIANVKTNFSVSYGTGASLTYIVKQNLSVRVFIDYNCSPSRFVSYSTNLKGEAVQYETHKTLNALALGASVNVMLW
ncbi:phosphatase PAP2 family protein [Parabacteroides provencensis]|uniref:phosphatase PAP2 family protein n=1 Tax=Parabacteroides provencensis TaxID=1944636 RepID=UPI000C15237E|nr:phosphatase PAP2 family protein [Parabacteroides provencensis]